MYLHVFFSVRWNVYVLKVFMTSLTTDFYMGFFGFFSKCGENDHRETGLEYV